MTPQRSMQEDRPGQGSIARWISRSRNADSRQRLSTRSSRIPRDLCRLVSPGGKSTRALQYPLQKEGDKKLAVKPSLAALLVMLR